MCTVLYDYQAFAMQHIGGVSRYFAELAAHVGQEEGIEARVPVRFSDNLYAQEILGIKRRPGFYRYRTHGARFLHALTDQLNQRALISALTTADNPIIHPTYYHPYVLSIRKPHRLVVTVYDMIHELFPDDLPDPVTVQRKKRLMDAADVIIAISHSTKSDIARLYPELESKTTVIHLAGSLEPNHIEATPLTTNPSVLFVGSRTVYKNFRILARSFAQIAPEFPGLELVCVGGGAFTRDEQTLLQALTIHDRCRQVTVSDSDLAQLYTQATLFVFPSLYEGFGLPVLEAMACGAPCLLSNTSSLPEVGGDAACYFDPDDGEALADTLAQLLADKAARDQMRNAGSLRAQQFSWEKSAQQHGEVYRAL